MTDFEDFTYEDDTHEYRSGDGIVRPSVTGTLKTAGVVNYSMVNPEVLEYKRVLGSNVHLWTSFHDRHGDNDPMSVTPREYGYCQAWLNFKRDFNPRFLAVETAMLRPIGGLLVGGTPDNVAIIRSRPWVIDKKCCATTMAAWELQVADYEMMLTQLPYLGVYGRMSVRLGPDGRYHPVVYTDPQAATVAKAALALAYNPKDQAARTIVDVWKYNKKIPDLGIA
jgi:hypothetical protein